MQCPKCKDPHFRYDESWYRKSDGRKKGLEKDTRQAPHPRTNFTARCKKCGFVGEVQMTEKPLVKIFNCSCNKKIETEIQQDKWFVAFCDECYDWKCGFVEEC